MDSTALAMFDDTVKFSDEDDIFIMPVCNLLDISYKYQSEVINKDHKLKTSTRKKRSMLLFGDKRERLTLTREAFIRWIQILNSNLVRPELVPYLEAYQSGIIEYLFKTVKNNKDERARLQYLYREIEAKKTQRKLISSEIKEMETEIKTINLSGDTKQLELNFDESKKLK